jgi:putative alpha-1,2-mannosidase
MKCSYSFSRRAPDLLAHEIATVLSSKSWFEFKGLFDVVYGNLRARNAAGRGEEMMRLSSYEKLQNLVSAGAVEKSGKNYRGLAPGLATFFGAAAALKADFATRKSALPAAV